MEKSRAEISGILNGKDKRFLLIAGPCSIHDTGAAFEYAVKLSGLRKKYGDVFCIVMRSYFEKPRTVSGWRGLIVEPDLNGFINIAGGLEKARQFLIRLAEIQVPAAMEMLDPIVPQYIADLVSWASIGARSAESQMHRELASGLSMPVGFKNTTDGNIEAAVNGVISSRLPHAFIGIARNGLSAIIHTTGNPDTHLILRGGTDKPNYDKASIIHAEKLLQAENLEAPILIDCSHGNSQRQPYKQKNILLKSLALRFDKAEPLLNWFKRHAHAVRIIAGLLIIFFGILMITAGLSSITAFFARIGFALEEYAQTGTSPLNSIAGTIARWLQFQGI